MLGLTGQPFWQAESYDHLVRSQAELERIEDYIIQNPVQAGLVRSEVEYPWSSVFVRAESPQQAEACPTSSFW